MDPETRTNFKRVVVSNSSDPEMNPNSAGWGLILDRTRDETQFREGGVLNLTDPKIRPNFTRVGSQNPQTQR